MRHMRRAPALPPGWGCTVFRGGALGLAAAPERRAGACTCGRIMLKGPRRGLECYAIYRTK